MHSPLHIPVRAISTPLPRELGHTKTTGTKRFRRKAQGRYLSGPFSRVSSMLEGYRSSKNFATLFRSFYVTARDAIVRGPTFLHRLPLFYENT